MTQRLYPSGRVPAWVPFGQAGQPGPQGSPFGFIPAGTGLEPAEVPPMAGPAGNPEAWARLWSRIPGDYAARSLALFQLQRSGYNLDPDTVIARWGVISSRILAAAGSVGFQVNFDTLCVVAGVRARLRVGAGLPDAFAFSIVIGAGSDGGWVLGSNENPAALTSIDTGDGTVLPIPVVPTCGRPNNSWQGTLIGDAGILASRVDLNLYAINLWTPNGQIQ